MRKYEKNLVIAFLNNVASLTATNDLYWAKDGPGYENTLFNSIVMEIEKTPKNSIKVRVFDISKNNKSLFYIRSNEENFKFFDNLYNIIVNQKQDDFALILYATRKLIRENKRQ